MASLFQTPSKTPSPSSLFSTPAKNALSSIKPATAPLTFSTPKPAVLPTSTPGSNGVKAAAPGAGSQGAANTIKPSDTAPQSQQTTVLPTSGQNIENSTFTSPPPATNQTTPSFGGIIGSLVNTANGGTQGVAEAQKRFLDAQNQYNQDLKSYNTTEAGLRTQQGIPTEFQTGRAAAYSQQHGAELGAEAQNVQAMQAALGTAYTGQGQTLGALQGAASATAPVFGSIGGVPFNPVTQEQGAILGSTQPGGLAAAGNLLGQFNGAQTAGAAPYQAQASNIQTAGTATAGAANTAYNQYYQQALGTNTALNQVQSLGNLALQTAQGGNINPLQVAAGNTTLAQFKRQLSSPSQAVFDQTMATFQGALSQLLSGSSNVTPTQVSTWSTEIANGTMPLATLQAIYKQGITEGKLKLDNINAAGAAAYQQLQGGGASGGNNDPLGIR